MSHPHNSSDLISLVDNGPERSILARLILPDVVVDDDPLEELHGLATTAGTEVVDELTQRRGTPDHSTYLGKGKVEELRLMVERHEAHVIFFDNDLSPAQVRNLEKATNARVIDRTELILDIFAAVRGPMNHDWPLSWPSSNIRFHGLNGCGRTCRVNRWV